VDIKTRTSSTHGDVSVTENIKISDRAQKMLKLIEPNDLTASAVIETRAECTRKRQETLF
jgi:hypothetical protein